MSLILASKLLGRGLEQGKLAAFTSTGGYPLAYLVDGHKPCCANCANTEDDDDVRVTHVDINHENVDLWCDYCECRIEAAYVSPEVELAPCPVCGGEARALGTLGSMTHKRCSCCGLMTYEVTAR